MMSARKPMRGSPQVRASKSPRTAARVSFLNMRVLPLRFAPAPLAGILFMKRWGLVTANLLAASTGCTSTALPIAACVPKATKSQHTCQPYCRQSCVFLPTDCVGLPVGCRYRGQCAMPVSLFTRRRGLRHAAESLEK